uniref:Uncharacterized protein n=1 Tax=Ditylenchus dipsaci TaxID=166011 RepID=A0A915DG99_9BILA
MDRNINNYRVLINPRGVFSCFSFCLDSAIHNAWQLHRKNGGCLDYLDFRRYVTTYYLRSNAEAPSPRGRKSAEPVAKRSKRVNDSIRYDGINHWLVDTDSDHDALCVTDAQERCAQNVKWAFARNAFTSSTKDNDRNSKNIGLLDTCILADII